jgi:hypothetical protein
MGDDMKKLISIGLLLGLSAPLMASAETWIASCNNLQFNFNRTSRVALVYFKTSTGIYQMARGSIGFDNGYALRAPLDGNSGLSSGLSLTEVGLNPSRNLVWVQYRNPTTGAITTGDFCTTQIQVVN